MTDANGERPSIQWKHIQGKAGLHAFVDPNWFKNPGTSTIWLRIYTALGFSHSDFTKKIRDCFQRVDWGEPVLLAFGQMGDLQVPTTDWSIYSQENGSTAIEAEVGNKKPKTTNYVFISTPCCIDGQEVPEVWPP